ncbi:MAG: hypothetical protein VB093_18070 [Propionicimonas sp.]|nr:hypothetical protein [Propionicimonas sp.]
MTSLVFVPLEPAELRAWAEAGRLAGPHGGYAVTPAMAGAFGLDDPGSEEAEYTALCVASVAGLVAHGVRIVAVAQAEPVVSEDEFGGVLVTDLRFTAVTSLFGEDPDDGPARAAVAAVAGLSLAEAWETPAVTSLLADTDLLWYGPGEWQVLAG